MKKFLLLSVTMITMTLAIFNFSSCKKKNSTTLSLEGLNDQLINNVYSSAEQTRAVYYKGYDDLKGAVKTMEYTITAGSTILEKNTTQYNQAGYQTSLIKYGGNNFTNKNQETTITYDNNNFITSVSEIGNNKTEYTITGGENTIEKGYFWSTDKWVLFSYLETTYKSKGKPEKVVGYVVENGTKTTVARTTIYTYDPSGNQLTDTTYEGVKTFAATGDILNNGTKITYDNKGNWINRTSDYQVITRTISYY